MKKYFLLIVLLLVGFTVVSCKTAEHEGHRQGITDTEIHVGNTAATSGSFASVGVPFNLAMQVVFDEYNADPAHTRDIVFHHYDDGFSVDGVTGPTLTQQLVEDDEVFALVGHFGTNTVSQTMDYLLETGIPMVYGVTGVNSLYFGHEKGNNILSIQPIYRTEGQILVARALHESVYGEAGNEPLVVDATHKLVLLYSEDDAGNSIRLGVEDQAAASGVSNYLTKIPFSATTAASAAAMALGLNGAAIIIASNQAPFTAAIAALEELNNTAPVFTSYVNAQATAVTADYHDPGFSVYANAWVDIVDPLAPAPTADQVGGDGTLLGYEGLNLPGFSVEYWEGFVKSMNNSSRVDGATSAKALWANSYAMAGYIAAVAFVELLERVDLDTVTWKSFIEAAESEVLDLPLAGVIDWTDGKRVGLDMLSLNKYIVAIPGYYATFSKVTPLEDLETILAK